MQRSQVLLSACSLALLLAAAPARGQTDVALSETLFQEGKRLMAAGNYRDACPKFAESQRLDPATGTLLNLGVCYKGLAKPASAWVAFNQAVASARRERRDDRVAAAQEEIQKIEAEMPRLSVTVPPESEVSGLAVTLDGSRIAPAARGVAAPVDPGTHVVTASAPGRKTWTESVVVGNTAETKNVVIPVLEPAGSGPSQNAANAPTSTQSVTAGASANTTDTARAPKERPRRFELGARLNVAIPSGKFEKDTDFNSVTKAQGGIWLELGYHLRPELTLGGFLLFGVGSVGSDFDSATGISCGENGVTCTAVDIALGLTAEYKFNADKKLSPWLGAGIGYEVWNGSIDAGDATVTVHAGGVQWLILQGGLDLRAKRLNFGPFLAVSFGRFTSASADCEGSCAISSIDLAIDNPAFHQWIMIGGRATVAP